MLPRVLYSIFVFFCVAVDRADGVQVRMGLEADCMDLLPSGKRASETILHGGVLVAGRKVWAEELTYLHVYVDEAGDHWARLFKTNQDEDNRATITSPPPPVTSRYTQHRRADRR